MTISTSSFLYLTTNNLDQNLHKLCHHFIHNSNSLETWSFCHRITPHFICFMTVFCYSICTWNSFEAVFLVDHGFKWSLYCILLLKLKQFAAMNFSRSGFSRFSSFSRFGNKNLVECSFLFCSLWLIRCNERHTRCTCWCWVEMLGALQGS
jgi:hypothetical protein